MIIKEKGEVTLQNRHGINYTVRLPEIVKAAEAVQGDFTIDGEVVFINPKTGEEEFTPCQRRCSTYFPDFMLRQQYPVVLKAFDIIKLGDEVVTDKPYWRRKALLKNLVGDSEVLQYVAYRRDVEAAWKEVVEQQREGLVVKNFNSRYELGERSWNWLKIKNWKISEAEVVGYTLGVNSRAPYFGALVLAKDGRFIGCVGSGFSDLDLMRIRDILRDSPRTAPPFLTGEPYVAVKTGLRVLVKYYKVQESGIMRFPIFLKTL